LCFWDCDFRGDFLFVEIKTVDRQSVTVVWHTELAG
jgi:hypothetical protein